MRMPQLVAAALLVAAAYSPARAETIEVVIDKLVFAPAEVNARVGDIVVWTNKDKFAHTATVKGGWEVMIPAGKSGSKVIEKAEAVDYFCRFHPNMKGRIITGP